ncbi:FKBP-type peptidyl-prolyl cis-trans isomerase [Flavobacterium sp.]|uniref:FKBP-type peptidyl-prolyl cis-trans isomerase n=1 Tax=Flavobacterium sp. TaxID=239 RepID=UPI002BDB6AC7|nr:FKBP-type peptidyl-prolyl cis-trans isomerase [Flavobacterium sp.]HSD08771.1 FKBP-type peptidyl-prolyl cis-trans isomerase [Flavobacterium sp.]
MKYSFLAIIAVLFMSCSDKDSEEEAVDYTEQNESQIKSYITAHDLDATRSDSGLYYVINEEGTGKQPTASSNVTVAYKGYYTDQTIFDKSKDAGVSFNLSQTIKGWIEGIPYFKEGGSGLLLVPAHLGYGSKDYYNIPGGSVLIFEIKLISVN